MIKISDYFSVETNMLLNFYLNLNNIVEWSSEVYNFFFFINICFYWSLID